jgi:hypothetical protein
VGDGLKIDHPAMRVFQRIGEQSHILQIGQKIEEWIAGFGNEDFVFRIAEQAKDVGVGLAGAGGEDDRFRIHGDVVVVEIVASDLCASCQEPFGLGIVRERVGILKCRKNRAGVVLKSARGGIGD